MWSDAAMFRGPEFNLSLELGFAGDGARAAAALSALWTCPTVDGPWEDPDAIGAAGQEGTAAEHRDTKRWRYGLAKIDASCPPLPFVLYFIREQVTPTRHTSDSKIEFGIQTQQPSDWLTLGVPVGMLSSWWPVDNSWSVNTQPWLSTLCRALAGIAGSIHHRAPLASGVLGEEASGCWRRPTAARILEAHQEYPPAALLTAEIIRERGGFVVPPDLWKELAPGIDPIVLPSGLLYAPPQLSAALSGA
jgi:hypothetical protein